MRHLIAGNVYVHHARSASFGHERRAELGIAGMAVLRERWPNYETEVAATLHSFERRVLDWRVRRIFATAATGKPERRVLAVAGGAPFDERGMCDSLQADAIEAIAVDGDCSPALSRIAAMLGIPLAERRAGETVDACGSRAIDAACSFPEAR
jgi:hypothetical protein